MYYVYVCGGVPPTRRSRKSGYYQELGTTAVGSNPSFREWSSDDPEAKPTSVTRFWRMNVVVEVQQSWSLGLSNLMAMPITELDLDAHLKFFYLQVNALVSTRCNELTYVSGNNPSGPLFRCDGRKMTTAGIEPATS